MPHAIYYSQTGHYLLYLTAIFTLLNTITASPLYRDVLNGPIAPRHPSLLRRCEPGTTSYCCDLDITTRRWALPVLQYGDSYEEVSDTDVTGATGDMSQQPYDLILAKGKKKKHTGPAGPADTCGPTQEPCCVLKSKNEPVPDTNELEPLPNAPNRDHIGGMR